MSQPDYHKLPPMIGRAVCRYVEEGIAPGGFVSAVLSNDLRESVRCADAVGKAVLFPLVVWLYNEVPDECWGSYKRVAEWPKKLKRTG